MTKGTELLDKRQELLGSWLAVMGNFIGYTKGEINAQLKQRLLVELMLSRPQDYPDIARTYGQIESLDEERAEMAKEAIAHHVNANDLTDEHFSQYMREIEEFAGDLGIQLPRHAGLYSELVEIAHA